MTLKQSMPSHILIRTLNEYMRHGDKIVEYCEDSEDGYKWKLTENLPETETEQ